MEEQGKRMEGGECGQIWENHSPKTIMNIIYIDIRNHTNVGNYAIHGVFGYRLVHMIVVVSMECSGIGLDAPSRH